MNFKNKPFDVKTLKGKNVAIIGEGLEGSSSAKYLRKKGASVTVLDKKQGENYLKNLDKYDLIVRSPGVKLSEFKTKNLKLKESQITSQTKLFFDLSPAKIIGVTGTKGKGTTSSLIYQMLKKQGFDAYLGGNIGVPPFDFLDKLNKHSVVVLEMSSFQLMDLDKSPNISVMLMVTSEHLDWHKSVDEYVAAKRNIFKHQTENDFAVINKDYPASRESDIESNGKIYYVSREEDVQRGAYVKDNVLWLKDPSINSGQAQKVVSTQEILIPGEHNFENALAATTAAHLAGVSLSNLAYVLKTFKGLEHRLELVATINGVKYYDDSFSTTPETAIAAINAFKNPEILILGGSSKNSYFAELGDVVSRATNIKAIIGIGLEWRKIKENITNLNPEVLVLEGAKDMQTIVAAASKIAVSGDVVLLSPACASFDMFKNYKDRGEKFKKEVERLESV